jgi:hypothetical protein
VQVHLRTIGEQQHDVSLGRLGDDIFSEKYSESTLVSTKLAKEIRFSQHL